MPSGFLVVLTIKLRSPLPTFTVHARLDLPILFIPVFSGIYYRVAALASHKLEPVCDVMYAKISEVQHHATAHRNGFLCRLYIYLLA